MAEENQNNENKPLSFEEFGKPGPVGVPRYNYFYMAFATNWYDDSPYFKRFAEENTKMHKELSDKINNRKRMGNTADELKPYEGELYEAYKIMKTYGATETDLLFDA